MKKYSTISSHFFLLAISAFLAISLFSCGEANVRLVNKVKTFEPQWAALNEKLLFIDRNLDVLEDRFEKDFKHIEGMLSEIPDSLRGKDFRNMLKDYESIINIRDTVRIEFNTNKSKYVETLNRFNVWENQIMAGEIGYKEGAKELDLYKELFVEMEAAGVEQKTELENIVGRHNSIIRELSSRADFHTNYDIQLK